MYSGEVRPPVARGDVDAVLARPQPPNRIGIIDGAFLHALALSPKEVLRALDAGVAVYGSSSLGALRAVECEPFGMVGVGRIFELFRTGELEADDEVAITYDPHTLRPLSEPMVNVRIALTAAVTAGRISPEIAAQAVAAAMGMYFPDRSYPRVLHELLSVLGPDEHERLRTLITSGELIDQKRLDALELIRALNAP